MDSGVILLLGVMTGRRRHTGSLLSYRRQPVSTCHDKIIYNKQMIYSPVFSIARLTALEAIRNRLVWLLLATVLCGFGLIQFIGDIAITETRQIQSALMGSFFRFSAVFIVALFVVAGTVREMNDKVIDLVFAMPITRSRYYAGKLLGSILFAILMVVVFCLPLLLQVEPAQVLLWGISLFAECLLMIGISLLCVFTFGHVAIALSIIMAFYLLSRSIGAIQLMTEGSMISLSSFSHQFMHSVVDGIAYLLPDLYRFTSNDWLVYGSGSMDDLVVVIIQTLVYLPLLAGAALFDLYRKSL